MSVWNCLGQQIVPPGALVAGRTLPEWTAEWWRWIAALPVDRNPWFDETGALATNGQRGPVFHLIGVWNETGTASRVIRVEEETYLLFPIINVIANPVGENPWGTLASELRDSAFEVLALTLELHGSVDGVPLTNLLYSTGQRVTNLFAHREIAPEFKAWLPATNNVFQYDGFELTGTLDPCFADGYWVMLAPLAPGRHGLTFGGAFGPPFSFSLEISYQIAVEPLDLSRAVRTLEDRVTAALPPKQRHPLMASLTAAQKAFESDRLRPDIQQVESFQEKIRAQLGPENELLAQELDRMAERITRSASRRLP